MTPNAAPRRSPRQMAYAGVTTAMLFWSLSYVWFKEAAANGFTPMFIITARIVAAALLFTAIAASTGQLQRVRRADILPFAGLALFEPFLYFMFEGHGLARTSATTAAVIIATIPLLTPVALRLFLGQRAGRGVYAGVAVSFAGAGLVATAGGGGQSSDLLGVGLMSGAALSGVGYAVMLTKIVDRYNTLTIMSVQNIAAAAMFLPFFLAGGGAADIARHPAADYLPVAKLALFASMTAFGLYTWSVRHIGVSRANMFNYLIPPLTAVAARFILGEDLYLRTVAGIGVVILGLALPGILSRGRRNNGAPADVTATTNPDTDK